jgi:lipopolysaccharide transport system permease protein
LQTTILPYKSVKLIDFEELNSTKDLLRFMVKKEFKIIYSNTKLGYLWAVLNPLLTMGLLTLVFGWIAKLDTNGLPYSVYYLSGLLCWTYFSQTITMSANSMISQTNVIKKVYFPRIYIPLTINIVKLIDLGISLVLFIGLLIYNDLLSVSLFIGIVPILLILFLATFGGSLWASALSAKYKDMRFAIPFLMQILFFASPVILSVSAISLALKGMNVSGYLSYLMALNPASAPIELLRDTIQAGYIQDYSLINVSIISSIVLVVSGLWYYNRVSVELADVL